MAEPQSATRSETHALLEVFSAFLKLGLTSFGGPIAHLGYFRDEFVARRRWLDEKAYADLVALCQFLPGPASSQVGMSIGILRAGVPGAVVAGRRTIWELNQIVVLQSGASGHEQGFTFLKANFCQI